MNQVGGKVIRELGGEEDGLQDDMESSSDESDKGSVNPDDIEI